MAYREELLEVYLKLANKKQLECSYLKKLGIDDFSLKQLYYLNFISESKSATTSTLAKELELSKPTVTEMIKRFEKLDCVYKESCNKDRRVQYIRLTEKGKYIVNIEKIKSQTFISYVVDNLESEDIVTLLSILKKLV